MDWEPICVALVDGAIHILNGFLIVVYWLYEQASLLAAALAVVWALRFGRVVRHEAGSRSRGYGCGELNRTAHGAAGRTLWAVASAVRSADPDPRRRRGVGHVARRSLAARERVRARRKQRREPHSFPLARLQTFVKDKAKACDIAVKLADARHTSQGCSRCRYIARADLKSQSEFACTQCGF